MLVKFIETRIIIILLGAICFSIFAERGHDYGAKDLSQIINVRQTWDKFDSYWYQKLAREGYPKRPFTDNIKETWGFMPMYPIIMSFFSKLFNGDLFLTGIFISNICTLIGLWVIYKLGEQQFKNGTEVITLILTSAGSFYLSIVYTEGLFVMLSALVFYLSYKKNYGWAFVIAGIASVTRIQGCLLYTIPLIELYQHVIKPYYKYLPAFVLSLLPMVIFMCYLNYTCGEPIAFIKIQHAWASSSLYPLQGFVGILTRPNIGASLINAFFWILILAVICSCYNKLPKSYIVFTVLYFLLSTSNELVYGTTRYMLGVLPLFFALSVSSNYLKQFFIFINILFLALTICAFCNPHTNLFMNSLMYSSEYEKMYHSENDLWWYRGLRDILKYYLIKNKPLMSSILDAGCGTGKNMEFFTSLGYTDVQGFDYSSAAIEFCRNRGMLQAKTGNILEINYADESFDVVCCMDVLPSLFAADRVLAVSEMFRVLKPGGILVCNAAALELFRSQHDNVVSNKTRFTKTEFVELFNRKNIEILKISYRVFLLSPLVLLFKITKRITGSFKSGKESASDQLIFPFGINWLLLQIQLIENKIFKRINLPFGSSIFIVVRKKTTINLA